jgi:flagella basal body P-ring formation protein FlgA
MNRAAKGAPSTTPNPVERRASLGTPYGAIPLPRCAWEDRRRPRRFPSLRLQGVGEGDRPKGGGGGALPRRGRFRYAAMAAIAASCAIPAAAQETLVPTPRVVIYPGDVIGEDMLADVAEPARDGSGPFVEQRSLIVGKVARLTLLPGHAIPFTGVSNRKVVTNGAEVRLIYSDGGLLIMTTGAALQDGSIGDIVQVRNDDSGVTVSGAVQPDGSVRVSGG